MRFHVGFSFRLKTLKKFIIPFLLGLLSYFGLSSFNLLQVQAYSNYSTYFNYDYEEINFEDYIFIDEDDTQYTMQDILDLANTNNTNYKINILVSSYYNSLIESYIQNVTFRFVASSYESLDFTIYNQRNSSSSGSNYDNFRIWNDSTYNGFTIDINNQYSGKTSTVYSISSLKDCLTNSNCPTSSNGIKRYTIYTDTKIDNSHNYSIDLWNNTNTNNGEWFYIQYKNEVPLILRQYGTNSNYYYLKSIKVNNVEVPFDTEFPTYCDLYTCVSGGGGSSESFELYLDKLPFVYSNTSNLSTYSSSITYSPTINVEDYIDNLYVYKFYYGRVNHDTYYTYESLNCTSSTISTSSNNTITMTTNNVSCSNNLSNYDKYFISYVFKYEDSNINTSLYGFDAIVNNGFIIHNNVIYSYLLDNFDNLSRGFSLLLSTNNIYNDINAYFYSNNDYIGFDNIARDALNITKTTDGYFYKNLPLPKKLTFGKTTNSNLLIYDDLSYSTNTNTFLYIYLDPQTMVSFVDTSNNTNSYTYYDTNNNIATSTIDLIYDTIDQNNFEMDFSFSLINNFLDSINSDLVEFHNVLDNIFDSIPFFAQSFIIVIYVLFLTYLLFRFIRK